MGTAVGGSVGQSLNQGQAGVQDPEAFAPAGVGGGAVAGGLGNVAQQVIDPDAAVAAAQRQTQTGTQVGFGGNAIGGADPETIASGNVGIHNT